MFFNSFQRDGVVGYWPGKAQQRVEWWLGKSDVGEQAVKLKSVVQQSTIDYLII